MPSQADRRIKITTPLGDDVLLVRSFTVEEELGRLFQIDLDLLSDNPNINFDKIVGEKVTVSVDLLSGEQRFFNGHVSRFVQSAPDGGYARYQATLVPWLWLLTRRADCRIFQKSMPEPPSDMTAPNIIKKIFNEAGVGDFRASLNETYPSRDYCVQYRETDFNFVSRLMEQEGIYYFFEHTQSTHTLVLADSVNAHKAWPGYKTIVYRPDSKAAKEHENISDWMMTKEVQPGVYVLNDFDYLKPKNVLRANAKIIPEHARSDFEIYDYPGEYVEHGHGDTYAQTRIEELHARHEVGRGSASAGGICIGSTFSMAEHPRDDQNREYLVTETSYRFENDEFGTDDSGSGEFCTCTFTAIPSKVAYRSPRTTPKPSIHGVQTAIVVGPAGEEIYTDEHARVKVQFHWDRVGHHDENSSCWVRVSQANAGKGWGTMITPRIGQEVIVEFIEGDPDRPIITGRVYNGDQKAPYADGKGVVSGMKSNTHKGSGYNEMSIDDTAGKEKITIHGQYDMESTIENDQTNKVNNKFTETIKNDATIKITQGKYSLQTAASEILIDAATKITLKSGASKITLEAGGDIKIEGLNVAITGTAKVQTKGAIVESAADATNTVKGGAMVTIKGAIVSVN